MTQIASGQNHYWSQQFGGPSTLTGGTAVVGVNDNTALFYNPGAAGLIDSAKVTASSYIYGMEYKQLKNGAGKGIHLKSLDLSVAPQMISASRHFKKAKNFQLIYGTMTRFVTDVSFYREFESDYNIINGSPGTEHYGARMQYNNGGIEQWVGLGAAYKVNKQWAVGFTAFGTYTHIATRIIDNLNADAVYNGVPYTTSANEDNSFSLDQFGLVFKLGVAARYKRVHVGLAVTMPGIKLYGRGSLDKSFAVYNLNQNPVDTNKLGQKYPSLVISDAQSGLVSNYRQPLTVAFGVKLLYPKFNISFALEYFEGYKNVMIVKGVDRAVIRPVAAYGNYPIAGFMSLQTSMKWVLNAGVGLELKLKPKVHVLLGLRTDFNNRAEYLPDNSALTVLPIRSPAWHYLYLSGGCLYKLARHEVTIGFDYGAGIPASTNQVANLAEPQQALFLRGQQEQGMKTYVAKMNLILSWTYYFKASTQKAEPFPLFEVKPKKKGHKARKATDMVQ